MLNRAAVLIALSCLAATAHAEHVASADRQPTCASDDRCVARQLAETLTSPTHALVLPHVIEFEPGRVRVYSAGRERIQALAEQWKKHRDWKVITVEGHGPAASDDLALRRAERIRDYLVRYGVPQDLIIARAADERNATPPVGTVDLSIEVCATHDCLRDSTATTATR